MESQDELKEIDIKNRTCYYLDDIMEVSEVYSGNILLDKKPYKDILIYDISYKTFMGLNPLRIRFHKIDGFIKIYDGIKYLLLSLTWLD